jgi:hypothetical protein
VNLKAVLARGYCSPTDAMILGLKGRAYSLIWLAVLICTTSAQHELQPWQQCGGRSNCADSQCADRSWEEVGLQKTTHRFCLVLSRDPPRPTRLRVDQQLLQLLNYC